VYLVATAGDPPLAHLPDRPHFDDCYLGQVAFPGGCGFKQIADTVPFLDTIRKFMRRQEIVKGSSATLSPAANPTDARYA
jgi:hypothetical protein